jgi:hypothetical protein
MTGVNIGITRIVDTTNLKDKNKTKNKRIFLSRAGMHVLI